LEGTFPLPEAQIDRFLLRIKLGYPEEDEEGAILDRFRLDDPLADLAPVTSPDEVVGLIQARRQVLVEESIRNFVVKVSRSTRDHQEIQLGASPRATLALYQSSQAWAAINGRDYVIPDDVKRMAPHVLTHRLMLSPQAQLRGRDPESLVADIVDTVPVPVEASH